MIQITIVDSRPTKGMKFKVDSAVRGAFTNTVPMHPTDAGFAVSDHVTHEMDKVTVTIVLGVIGGDISIDGGNESEAGGRSVRDVVTSTGEIWRGNVTRSQIKEGYDFLKEICDKGTVVGVNLNY